MGILLGVQHEVREAERTRPHPREVLPGVSADVARHEHHTIRSYRDGLVLYLRFVSTRKRCGIEALDIEHLTAAQVEEFLADLERARGNGIPTRNVRLAALHTFARFAVSEAPEHLAELQRILAIPFKRGRQRVPLEYLDQREVEPFLRRRLGQPLRKSAITRSLRLCSTPALECRKYWI